MTATLITCIISWAVSFFLGGLASFIIAKYRGMQKREKALQDGVQSLLRNQLIEYHDKYTRRGYCPIYAKESARRSYEAYHELGGNGVITKLYEDIMALPETPAEKKARAKTKTTNQGGEEL